MEDLDLETIIAELDAPHDGTLPKRAIREAQRRGTEIVPRLIDLVKKGTATIRAGEMPTTNGHLFALYLLTEFRARDALPAIVEAMSLPGDGSFELFGDAITEDLNRMFAVLAAGQPELMDALISDRSINEYVRWQAATTYLHWVRDGRWTREQAVQKLRKHLLQATRDRDDEAATGLVSELVSYSPHECLDEINEAFQLDLVDEMFVDEVTVAESIREGESWFQREMRNLRPDGVQDTVEELERWANFRESDRPGIVPRSPRTPTFRETHWADEPEPQDWQSSGSTIRIETARVGRNEPCPCGSGKKYKKCCGREGR